MKKQVKEALKQKLVSFATIYLGGLKKTRQKKLNKYLEEEMNAVADYYVSLLTKKQLASHLPAAALLENTANQVLHTDENAGQLEGLS